MKTLIKFFLTYGVYFLFALLEVGSLLLVINCNRFQPPRVQSSDYQLYLGYNMRGGDESDCINSFRQYLLYLIEQLFRISSYQGYCFPRLADFMILAINTSQVAALKKNIANSPLAANYRFFSPVDANRCNIKAGINSAEAGSPFKPVNTTLSGT